MHADALYDALTGGYTRSLRLAELLTAAAARVPGLVPAAADLAAERARPLPEKEGIEFAQGLLVGHLLARPRAGRHLIGAMLRPVPEAIDRLGEFRAAGTVDLGPVQVTRHGRAGVLELRNPRHLNAEDDVTLGPTECAVDLILLDPDIDIGVFRGARLITPGTRECACSVPASTSPTCTTGGSASCSTWSATSVTCTRSTAGSCRRTRTPNSPSWPKG